jgi:DUF4097 and DUF4098 domain-containing protein YvlB
MPKKNHSMFIMALASCSALAPWSLAHADRSIDERHAANPTGLVEIVNVAGSVELRGWDHAEVQVTGTVDDAVDRVDLTSDGDRTSVHVVMRSGMSWHGGQARLIVNVPAASAVSVSLVSADLKIAGIRGDAKLSTVSGDVEGDVHGDLRVDAVSGSLHVTAREAQHIEVKSISGDVDLTGGGGEVEVTTVSGTAKAALATLSRARFKTVSGDVTADLALSPGAQLDGESVGGDITFNFAAAPDADIDVQSFSGEIHNCFGPKPVKAEYGPGSRLAFTNGSGHARVHVDTKSGDVRLCTQGAK